MPILASERRPVAQDEAGLGPVAKDVVEHASALARLEVQLALLEVKRKLGAVALGIGLAAGAGLLALFALGFGLATLAAALATAMSTWLALLIVTALLVILTATLGLVGMHAIKKGVPPIPEQAIEEAKRTSEAVRADGRQRA
jgi:Putative Actinobacterial Holin-X, holin superfamily III